MTDDAVGCGDTLTRLLATSQHTKNLAATGSYATLEIDAPHPHPDTSLTDTAALACQMACCVCDYLATYPPQHNSIMVGLRYSENQDAYAVSAYNAKVNNGRAMRQLVVLMPVTLMSLSFYHIHAFDVSDVTNNPRHVSSKIAKYARCDEDLHKAAKEHLSLNLDEMLKRHVHEQPPAQTVPKEPFLRWPTFLKKGSN